MKHNEMLTDVKLQVMQEIFPAHKIILAAASPYFRGAVIASTTRADVSSQITEVFSPFCSNVY